MPCASSRPCCNVDCGLASRGPGIVQDYSRNRAARRRRLHRIAGTWSQVGLDGRMFVPPLDRHEQGPGREVQPGIGVLGLGRVLVVEGPRELGIESRERERDEHPAVHHERQLDFVAVESPVARRDHRSYLR